MDRSSLMKAMKNSISNVLEKMFFLTLEVSESRGSNYFTGMNNIICSRLMFKGQLSGQFFLYIPGALANTMTADFLGMEKKDISNDEVIGTLKEIINMIAGNTFALYDDKAVFNLGIPAIFFKDNSGADRSENDINITIKTPDSQMVLKLSLNQNRK